MSRPRVLHVITRLDRGGSAENTLLCAAHLRAYETVVAVGPTQGERSPTEALARQQGVEFVEVPQLVRPLRPVADLRALWQLWRLMRRGRYDLVHTHTSKAGLLGRVAAYLARVPCRVHTAHGHVFYGYHGPALSRLFVWLERWAAWITHRLIALTPAERADQLRFGVGSPAKFSVIHSGVDFAPFLRPPADREVTRRVLGLGLDGVVVGTLGRLTPIKGQADLLRAFALVRPQVPEAWLLVVGDGEEGLGLAALARELGVAGRVVFAGWREEVPDLLRAMDLFVLPSLNEGMGKALVEAMFVGLPVVATRVGGVPDLVGEGRSGLLVAPGQPEALAAAILELAADPRRRRDLGARAAQVAREYSVESMIEKLDRLYQSLLKESKRCG